VNGTPPGRASWLLAVPLAAACAGATPPATQPRADVRETVLPATLHHRTLDLHLAQPAAPAPGTPLVIYASGDGGWFGAAVDMWRDMARDGYVTVGFSSRAFLKIERPRGSIMTPAQVAQEYHTLIEQARRALGIPAETPAILTGWSRGAAFAVLVGSEPSFADHVLGVVAIGLPEDEDLLVHGAEDETDEGTRGTRARPFDNYARIGTLAERCAVIQATHDNFFPAAAARLRFGPDTGDRRMYAIDAANHRFSGGTAEFFAALRDSLRWIASSDNSAR
jgi:hypothetical protein